MGYNSAMMFRTRPRDKKPDTRTHIRKIGPCDFCDSKGNWWHIRSEIVCDRCLGLTTAKQKAIGRAHGIDELYKRLDEKLKQLTEGDAPVEKIALPCGHMDRTVCSASMCDGGKLGNAAPVNPDIKKVRAELKARAGKLYLIENAYVNASRRARKLADAAAAKIAAIQAQVSDSAREAKEAQDKFEGEKLAIEELERVLLVLKIEA